jgi:hypothetical protein
VEPRLFLPVTQNDSDFPHICGISKKIAINEIGFKEIFGDLRYVDTSRLYLSTMAIMAEGASAVPEPSIVPEPIEPKRSCIPTLTRLLPYWFTVASFVWAIALAHSWNSDKAYEGFQAQVVDPVRASLLSL